MTNTLDRRLNQTRTRDASFDARVGQCAVASFDAKDAIDTRHASRCDKCRNQARICKVGMDRSRACRRQSHCQRKSKAALVKTGWIPMDEGRKRGTVLTGHRD
jgi:hypothetical protein